MRLKIFFDFYMKSFCVLGLFLISTLPFLPFNPYTVTPPGTTRLNDSLFVDICELSVSDWNEYSFWLKRMYGEDSDEYKACFPDSTVWRKSIYEQVAKSYFKHPAYYNFPIVGITYEQAVAYCEWRSIQVNYMLYARQNKLAYSLKDDTVGIPQIYKYRLPSKQEWEVIASLGFSKKTLKQIEKSYNPNIYNLIYPRHQGENATNAINLNTTAKVNSFWTNLIGCYHIFGNVAEMTDTKGLAKGGAWLHNAYEVTVDRDFYYKGSQDWVGVRCVCEKVMKSEKEIARDSLRQAKLERKFQRDSIKQEKLLQKQERKRGDDSDEDDD